MQLDLFEARYDAGSIKYFSDSIQIHFWTLESNNEF